MEAHSQRVDEKRPTKKPDSQPIHRYNGFPNSYHHIATDWFCNIEASFSPDGSFILLHDFSEHKTYRIDTQTLEKTIVSSSRRNRHVTMHHITGEIFAVRYCDNITDAKLEQFFPIDLSQVPSEALMEEQWRVTDKGKFDLVCFRDLDDFKSNKPNWTMTVDDIYLLNGGWWGPLTGHGHGFHWRDSSICWLPKHEVYAWTKQPSLENRYTEELLLIDRNGRLVSQLQFGIILGIDITESGIEVYHQLGKREPFFVQRSLIHEKLKRVEKTEKLGRLPDGFHNFSLRYGSKLLRYTNHRPGDVRKFFTSLMNDPRFWTFQDYPDLASNFQGKHPELTLDLLANLRTPFVRQHSLGKLSAMDDPSIPEIVRTWKHTTRDSCELIMDHSGNVIPLPIRVRVVDAIFDEKNQMMVTVNWNSHKGNEFHLTKLVTDAKVNEQMRP